MRFKMLSMIAALVFVSACATEPEETTAATDSGTQTTAAPAPAPAATTREVPGFAAGSVKDFLVNVGDRVFFGFDSADIQSSQVATIEKQAAWLRRFPGVTIVVEGHADERGTREYNLALGERRANAHKDYLISLGVSAGRIETVSFGKERPAVLGSNESAWAQNRRGVIVLKNAPAS